MARKNLLKGFMYYSNDRFDLASTNKYHYYNLGGSIDWRHHFSSALFTDIAAVYSKYSFEDIDNIFPPLAYSQEYSINHYEFKTDFTWYPGDK